MDIYCFAGGKPRFLHGGDSCILCPMMVSLHFSLAQGRTCSEVNFFFPLLSLAGETTTTVAPFVPGGVSDGQWHSVQVQYYNKVRLILLLMTVLFIKLIEELVI